MNSKPDTVIHQQMLMIAAKEHRIQGMHKEIATLRAELATAKSQAKEAEHLRSELSTTTTDLEALQRAICRGSHDLHTTKTAVPQIIHHMSETFGVRDLKTQSGRMCLATFIWYLNTVLGYVRASETDAATKRAADEALHAMVVKENERWDRECPEYGIFHKEGGVIRRKP